MASIKQRNGKYTVQIRKKACEMYATFEDEQTAKLWAYYKEKAIDEIEAFDVPLKELFTLGDMIHGKVEELRREGKSQDSINDVNYLKQAFPEFLDLSMEEITYELLQSKAKDMLNSIVRRGGNAKKGTGGILSQQTVGTVTRKLRCLGTVFSFAQEQNLKIDNPAHRLANEFKRREYEKKGNDL